MSAPDSSLLTSEQIYDALRQYQALGVIQYVLPTEPIGEEWILGQAGSMLKLIGDGQAAAWLAGAHAVATFVAARGASTATTS